MKQLTLSHSKSTNINNHGKKQTVRFPSDSAIKLICQ